MSIIERKIFFFFSAGLLFCVPESSSDFSDLSAFSLLSFFIFLISTFVGWCKLSETLGRASAEAGTSFEIGAIGGVL